MLKFTRKSTSGVPARLSAMTCPNAEFPNLQVFKHPLIQHKLTWMRDETTSYRAFRALLAQIAGLMVYEVMRSFETVPVEVQTPMTPSVPMVCP